MDSIFAELFYKQRNTIQVRADALLALIELLRTKTNADLGDTAAIADKIDLLRTAANAIQAGVDLMVADDAALITQSNLNSRYVLNHFSSGIPALTYGSGSAKKIKLTNTMGGLVAGGVPIADVSTAEIDFTDTTEVTNGNSCRYLVTLTAAGALFIINGTQAGSTGAAVLPAVPADSIPLGELLMTADTGTFTPGAGNDDISDANFTDVFTDFNWPTTGADAITAAVSATGSALGDQGIGAALGAIEEAALSATGLSALGTFARLS